MMASTINETCGNATSSHLSAKLDNNSFYADKLAGLRAKIASIQNKHEQTVVNNTVVHEKHSPLRFKEHIVVTQIGRERCRSKSLGRLVDDPVIMSNNFDALQAPTSCFADSTE